MFGYVRGYRTVRLVRYDEDAETHAERVELLRRRLLASVTRARDEPRRDWVGATSSLLGVDGGRS
jgi:hypothetical protein